jgi:molecular chaperone HtpG
LHTKAEGKIEYTNLLFIPSIKPFDLFHPERRRRVKLYVKRVFITDENVDIVPAYMRFLRGIVDSQDLPLNISRETLQKNPILDKIRESIVKKVLGELKKRLKKNAEEYDNFWEIFGGTLKEGLCEAIAPKEQILEVCRFYSSTQEGRTTLDAYIERMGNDQESINYITGDRIETLRNSPQLEGFKAKGIEVLLLNDHVDDFWINVVQDYKGKNFRSVMLADNSEAKNAEDTKDETAKQSMDALLDAFKTLFPEELKDVRTTHKLTETAVCLAIAEGDMDMRMERFLRDHQQLNHKSQRILEVNPNHVIIQNLAQQLESGSKPEDIRDAASLLLDQAKIVEGEEIEDPAAFSRRLSAFMEKGLAA